MTDKKNSEVAVASPPAQSVGFAPTPENIELLKTTLGDVTLRDNELQLFLYQAQRTGLDPLARQIFVMKNGRGQVTFMTSIDGQRLVAQRTKEYQGQVGPEWCGIDGKWKDVWLSLDRPAAARVGVYRKGFQAPVYGVATAKSYDKGNGVWKDKPDVMLAKCAEALALRKAFPQELAGLYTPEEMPEQANHPQLSMADLFKRASDKLARGGVNERDDKIAIILGIAEVESADQLTPQKMLAVMKVVDVEPVDNLKALYLRDTDVVDVEPVDKQDTAAAFTDTEPVDNYDQTPPADTDAAEVLPDDIDLVEAANRKAQAERQAAEQESKQKWIIPDFKPSKMPQVPQLKLIKTWLDYLATKEPDVAMGFINRVIGRDRPATALEAMQVLQMLADTLNGLEDKDGS